MSTGYQRAFDRQGHTETAGQFNKIMKEDVPMREAFVDRDPSECSDERDERDERLANGSLRGSRGTLVGW